MMSLGKCCLVYLLAIFSPAGVFALQAISTLDINWDHRTTDLGIVYAGSNVNIVWDVSGDPDNFTLSVLLKRNTTTSSAVVAIAAAGSVPNNGSFLWGVPDTLVFGGGYYIRLQTGNSSDWGNGTNDSPPTLGGVYGLAGFFTVGPPPISPTTSSTTTTGITTTTRSRPTTSIAPTPISTLDINWGHRTTNLGIVYAGSNVNIVWDVSGDPDDLTLSVLLKRNTTTSSEVVAIAAAGRVPNRGSFLWDVPDTLVFGGGYYIRLQTGSSSDWGNGTNDSPPTPGGIYGLAGFFMIEPPPIPPTTSSTTTKKIATTSSHHTTTTRSRPTSSIAPTPISTLDINWGHRTTNLGTVYAGSNVNIVWDVSGNPDDLTLSVLLKRNTTTSSEVVAIAAAGRVPNRGSFLWDVPDTLVFGGGYYIRLQTGNSSDWGNGTDDSPPTLEGVYGLAGFFTIELPVVPSAGSPAPAPTAVPPAGSPAPSSTAVPPAGSPAPSTAVPPASLPTPVVPPASLPAPSSTAVPPASSPAPSPTTVPPASSPAPARSSSPAVPAGPSITPSPGFTQILTTLPVNWRVSNLNGNLGSIIPGTNVSIIWDPAQDFDNIPLSVLLKQGNSSEGGQVVSIPASKNVPNNGLFVWHVEPSLPPGSVYYIRVQTGTSDDWDGGIDSSSPTPGAIYGLAGFFTINSTFRGSAAVDTVVATRFITCCKGSSNPRRSGIIAGSVLGGLIALGFLASLGWFVTRKRPPVPGANPGEKRKFRFEIPQPILAMAAGGPEGFDPAQLTLILRPEKFPGIKPIAWQVFTIDGRQPSFSATLPPDRGFGDLRVEEDPNTLAGILHARHDQRTFVPPGWLIEVDDEDGIPSFKEPSNFSKKRSNHIAIENRSEVPHSFTLGSLHLTHDEGEDDRPFQPFAMIEGVQAKKKLVVPHALNLQIYLTHQAQVGQVMTDDQLTTPLLRPAEGIKVAKLQPGSVTTWTVNGSDGPGGLSLEMAHE